MQGEAWAQVIFSASLRVPWLSGPDNGIVNMSILGPSAGLQDLCHSQDIETYEKEEKQWNSRRPVRLWSAITAASSPHTGPTVPCTPASSSVGLTRGMRRL